MTRCAHIGQLFISTVERGHSSYGISMKHKSRYWASVLAHPCFPMAHPNSRLWLRQCFWDNGLFDQSYRNTRFSFLLTSIHNTEGMVIYSHAELHVTDPYRSVSLSHRWASVPGWTGIHCAHDDWADRADSGVSAQNSMFSNVVQPIWAVMLPCPRRGKSHLSELQIISQECQEWTANVIMHIANSNLFNLGLNLIILFIMWKKMKLFHFQNPDEISWNHIVHSTRIKMM